MILLIDNYDSFTFNLYQYLSALDEVHVKRNDVVSVEEICALNPDAIVISPGPGYPKDAGVSIPAIQKLGREIPFLGVCLGHQALCEAFGGTIIHAKTLMHGKESLIHIDVNNPLFAGLPEQISVARYHSLAAREETLPDELRVIGRAQDGEIMALAHERYPLFGVQFHPESIMTPDGMRILENFIDFAQRWRPQNAQPKPSGA